MKPDKREVSLTLEEIKHCLWCGKNLPKRRRKYCSDECGEEYFTQKIAPLWWRNAVKLALRRANNQCEKCGSLVDLQVHHKEALKGEVRWNNAKNRLDNLVVLCRDCHWQQHRGIEKKTGREHLMDACQSVMKLEYDTQAR